VSVYAKNVVVTLLSSYSCISIFDCEYCLSYDFRGFM